MTSKGKASMGLFEFLEEAELQQYYSSMNNILQVHNVQQLKYVDDEDLFNIGMSRPEAKRLKTLFHKMNPQTYASKLKKFLKTGSKSKDELKQEFLLEGEEDSHGFGISISASKTKRYSSLANIRVPFQHIIPADAISIHKELGSGEFGVVQQGVWTDDDQVRHQVAIKCLSKDRMQNNTFEFMKEYEIMQSIDHPYIVRLFGVVLDADQIMLITELAPLRSLLECLKEPSLRSTFTVMRLASFACQICEGMKYLETKRLIHRDLAARNILVFSKTTVKISDFGLSRALGVGKDYYQTNFNVNLKLPIAWCAPECINFLKFTSASDVWAFGVTMWEMFSYGFQPWAAQTGQQILEAIDEPQCQRLEQPDYCPNDHYSIMLQCWKHDLSKRPTFEQLTAILEEAKPEQVQVVTYDDRYNKTDQETRKRRDMLKFEVGDIITVLDKQCGTSKNPLWKGVLNNGRIGVFNPKHTVAYVGTLPSQGNHTKWQNEENYGAFQRGLLRTSSSTSRSRSGSRRKISRDMISGPRGEVQHTGHIGIDGAFFGNVGFNVGATVPNEWKWEHQQSVKSVKSTSLTRADSDVSERAPLIGAKSNSSIRNCNHYEMDGSGSNGCGFTANKNPRMGYAIGYLRKSNSAGQQTVKQYQEIENDKRLNHNNSTSSKEPKTAVNSNFRPHDYHSISDEDDDFIGCPLDLGPSLLDEVFSELETSKDSIEERINKELETTEKGREAGNNARGRLHSMKDMRELVSSTLTLHSRRNRHKNRQQATVKPIKASDEKVLNNAIAMANVLASKSMNELDKRHLDDFYDHPPPVQSPDTPNTPSKKFSFWFPGRSTSPRGEGKHFVDDINNAEINLESLLTPGAKDAYRVLVEGKDFDCTDGINEDEAKFDLKISDKCIDNLGVGQNISKKIASNEETIPSNKGAVLFTTHKMEDIHNISEKSDFCNSDAHRSADGLASNDELNNFPETAYAQKYPNNNPLPLPPKSSRLNFLQPQKRHVRKNPLIIPSGMAANILQKRESIDEGKADFLIEHQSNFEFRMPRNSAPAFTSQTLPSQKKSEVAFPSPPAGLPKVDSDDFEEQIASSMDALDNINCDNNVENTPSIPVPNTRTNHSCSHPSQNRPTSIASISDLHHRKETQLQQIYKSKTRGQNSDEVRIMQKVLGGNFPSSDCVNALDSTEWNVHHAIKLIKLRNLVNESSLSDLDLRVALQTRDWDLTKAANLLVKRCQNELASNSVGT